MSVQINAKFASHLIRETGSSRYLIFNISGKADEGQENKRVPLNLCLVLDRSGSMAGEKLERVKEAATRVLKILGEQDRVSVVAYDDEIEVVAEGGKATANHKALVKTAINRITSGNMTNLSEGWLTGCELVARSQKESAYLNSCWLLTDGLANKGMIDPEELGYHAAQLHKRGISTTTFGVGDGFNEDLLRLMADKGGGNFYFISSASKTAANFTGELQERMTTVARNLELTIEFEGSPVMIECLNDYEQNQRPGSLTVSLGDLYAGEEKVVVIHLITPARLPLGTLLKPKSSLAFLHALTGRNQKQSVESNLTLQCASQRECDQQTVDSDSALAIATVLTARARQSIVAANRKGSYQEVTATPEQLHQQLYRAKIAHFPAVQALQTEIDQLAREATRPLTEQKRKTEYYTSHLAHRSRRDY